MKYYKVDDIIWVVREDGYEKTYYDPKNEFKKDDYYHDWTDPNSVKDSPISQTPTVVEIKKEELEKEIFLMSI